MDEIYYKEESMNKHLKTQTPNKQTGYMLSFFGHGCVQVLKLT